MEQLASLAGECNFLRKGEKEREKGIPGRFFILSNLGQPLGGPWKKVLSFHMEKEKKSEKERLLQKGTLVDLKKKKQPEGNWASPSSRVLLSGTGNQKSQRAVQVVRGHRFLERGDVPGDVAFFRKERNDRLYRHARDELKQYE